MEGEAVRIDKWLWAVRAFHTRAEAARACRAGHVRIDGRPVKASRDVRVGEVVASSKDGLTRTLRVRALLHQRVGAKLVAECADDLTPPEEYARQRERRERERAAGVVPRAGPGAGRPTKRERRRFDDLFRPKG
jgi:ribosome-associated heat shock protein Hsp15